MVARLIIIALFTTVPLCSITAQVSVSTARIVRALEQFRVGTDTSKYFTSSTDTITSASTHRQIPTAKSVWDALGIASGASIDTFYVSSDTLYLQLTGGPLLNVVLPNPGVFTAGPLTGSGTSFFPLNVLSNSINDVYIQQNSIDSTEVQTAGLALENISRDGAETGQVIRWNGTAWVAAGVNNYELVTTSQAVSASLNQVFIDTLTASITLNLPACNAANNGVRFEFVKSGPDTFAAIIEPAGVEEFYDGSTTKTLYSLGTSITCTCRWSGSAGVWLYSIW